MYFSDIAGHKAIKERLIKSVNTGRISHSQLFQGSEGSAKLALVLAYARYILCTDRQAGDACGKCASCVKVDKYAHPDLHFVFPSSDSEVKKSAEGVFLPEWREALIENPYMSDYNWSGRIGIERKQGMIKKTESTGILRKLGLKAFESDHKILVMWMAERMNATASNMLLKIIEEPPKGTVFLLVVENQDRLLTTILSRTQIIRIPKFSDQEISEMLSENPEHSERQVENAVKMANGNYHLAISSIKVEAQTKENFDIFVSFMRTCFAKDVIKLMSINDNFSAKSREWQKNFLHYSMRMLRENFMVNQNKKQISHMADYEDDFSIKFSRFINPNNILNLYEEFNKAYADISANGYARIVFLDLSLKIIKLLQL